MPSSWTACARAPRDSCEEGTPSDSFGAGALTRTPACREGFSITHNLSPPEGGEERPWVKGAGELQRNDRGGLTGEFIADIVLQLLSYMAQVERDNIRQRQAEGIAAAQARGVRFGRPRIERPDEFSQVQDLFERDEITVAEAAKRCGVSRSTFRRWLAECEAGA